MNSAVEGETVEESEEPLLTTLNDEVEIGMLDGGESKDAAFADLVSPSPTVMIKIAGVEIGCVIDTGAEASVIPSETFREYLEPVVGSLGSLDTSFNIVGFEGTEVPVEGYIRVPINIQGHDVVAGFLVTSAYPVRGRRREFPVLVGCNILKLLARKTEEEDLGFHIVLDRRKVPVRTESDTHVLRRAVITSTKEEIIQPRSGKRLPCNFGPEPPETLPGMMWLVQPCSNRELPVEVVEGCVMPGSTKVDILIINKNEVPVIVPPHTQLTVATAVELKSEVYMKCTENGMQVNIQEVLVTDVGDFQEYDSKTENKDTGEGEVVKMDDGTLIILPPGVTLAHLPIDNARKVASLLDRNRMAFSSGEYDIGMCNLIPHKIETTSNKPIRLPYRRVSPVQMAEVRELLQDLLEKKIIRRSASPYASPVVLVKKKCGAIRLCIDYRLLNDITVKDSFPLPRIDESLEAMGGAKFFSSMDLSHGYFQITMDEQSIPYTAFRVPWGLFEFLRMPQGLCNSPGTFQRVMEFILGDLNLRQLVLYLDDILVFATTLEEHLERLNIVFQRLIQHGLKLKGGKCCFFQSEVRHLGHVVSAEGVSVDPEKVERILNWPIPKTGTELSSFLGLASYYRRFVPGFAKIAAPLHELKCTGRKAGKPLRNSPNIVWSTQADEKFTTLKKLLSSAPVLNYPRFDKDFVVEVDASLQGLGACLMQEGDDRRLHPVAYASRGLRGAERNYPDFSSFKIELLGLKWAIAEKFREYLIGSKCKVLTDNNPLAHLQTANLGATEQRWVAQLAPFDLDIQYRSGRLNRCADALSRCPANAVNEDTANVSSYVCNLPESLSELIMELTTISILPVEIRKKIQSIPPLDLQSVADAHPTIFPSFTHSQLAEMQKNDDGLAIVWMCWTSEWKPGDDVEPCTSEIKSWLRVYSQLVEHHGVLYREVQPKYGGTVRQLLVPQTLRTRLMEMAHDEWGHQGINRTFSILQARCFWPGLHKDVQVHLKNCFTCKTTKIPSPAIHTPRRHILASRPLELLAIDFLKLDRGKGGFEDVLVMTDAFTKYSLAVPCRHQTAVVVARVLRDHWFSHYGAPAQIHSDQGRNFESSLIRELCKLYGIEKTRTTPYHPQGNGQTERFNRTLCQMIRSLEPSARHKWPELITQLVFLYNSTPHSVTGFSPFRLLYGREPFTPIDQLLINSHGQWTDDFVKDQADALLEVHQIARDRMETALQAGRKRHNRLPMSKPLAVGAQVLLKKCAFQSRHKLEDKYSRQAFVVVDVNEEKDVYRIRPVSGGPEQIVNRKLLIEDPRNSLPSHAPEESDPEDAEMDMDNDITTNSLLPYWLFLPTDGAVEENPPKEVRRSRRITKGQHSNPARLPRSAVPNN